jgi:hypothetical protein
MKHSRFLIFGFRSRSRIKNRESRIVEYALFLFLWFVPLAPACAATGAIAGDEELVEPARPSLQSIQAQVRESRYYLMEGVYYLLNEGDRDTAEEFFRKVIFSSPFSSLSREGDPDKPAVEGSEGVPALPSRWIVAEAFYFLGKIHYEEAVLDAGSRIPDSGIQDPASDIENIAWAKKYLKKAEEYGIVYDRLHPPLLDEIDRKYPGIETPIPRASRDKANVIIEIDHEKYQIDAVKIDESADFTESKFSTKREIELECGARYKMKPDVQGGHKVIYRTLTVFGIGLVIWLTRS